MMYTARRFISFVCMAFASCLSMVGFAHATESLTSYHLRALALDSGQYGAESAKLKVELAHMQSIGAERTGSSTGLVSMSNHFVQAFLTKSGVAGGKSGVGPSASALA